MTQVDTSDAEAKITNAVRTIITKATPAPKPVLAQPAALILNFDGAGQPLTVGMGGIPEMPSGSFRIVGAHLAAGIWNPTSLSIVPITVTASVDIRLASHGMWQGGARPLYGTTRPGLSAQAEADINITSWITELQPGDMLAYALATFTGAATVLTLTLTLRRIDVIGIDAPSMNDLTGVAFTDVNGRPFASRF